MVTATTTQIFIQATAITTALLGAGGIATLSAFDIPELLSQPASRSLPSIRWLFSRGSHVFPQAAFVSFSGFVYLANTALPASQSFTHLISFASNSAKVNGYLAAGVLCIAIGPWTSVMVPTNFRLMELHAQKGGKRSAKSDSERKGAEARSAEDTVAGEGEAAEFSDLSGPQEQTPGKFSAAEEQEVKQLLNKFMWLNWVRAGLIGVGGVVGLVSALL